MNGSVYLVPEDEYVVYEHEIAVDGAPMSLEQYAACYADDNLPRAMSHLATHGVDVNTILNKRRVSHHANKVVLHTGMGQPI